MPRPRIRTHTLLEAAVEKNVVDYAERKYGLRAYKLNVQGRRNLPDRMFLVPGGRPLFIEFKRKGQLPRPGQVYEAELLKSLGYRVELVDDIPTGRAIIDSVAGTTSVGARK